MRIIAAARSLSHLSATPVLPSRRPAVDPARADAAIKSAFPDRAGRLAVAARCRTRRCGSARRTATGRRRRSPRRSRQREKATIVYPPDGKLIGDWKKGEALAQSGYGLRFTDYPPRSANGGNCYACHQLTRQEVSYGTLGPPLLEYGKLRNFSEADAKAAYEKIYNSHAAFPCSNMPRFGANKILTIEQIKDAVALLMSPDSPVNK